MKTRIRTERKKNLIERLKDLFRVLDETRFELWKKTSKAHIAIDELNGVYNKIYFHAFADVKEISKGKIFFNRWTVDILPQDLRGVGRMINFDKLVNETEGSLNRLNVGDTLQLTGEIEFDSLNEGKISFN